MTSVFPKPQHVFSQHLQNFFQIVKRQFLATVATLWIYMTVYGISLGHFFYLPFYLKYPCHTLNLKLESRWLIKSLLVCIDWQHFLQFSIDLQLLVSLAIFSLPFSITKKIFSAGYKVKITFSQRIRFYLFYNLHILWYQLFHKK